MPATLGRLFIDPGGISTVINITGPAGGLLTTYTAVNGASATSFPDTITTLTEYNFTEIIPATISAKVNGVETANSAGGTLTVNMGRSTGQQVAVGLSGSEVATAIAGISTLASSQTLADSDVASLAAMKVTNDQLAKDLGAMVNKLTTDLAAVVADNTLLRADVATLRGLVNSLIDDGQALGFVA